MNISALTSSSLQLLLTLTKKRESILAELAEVDSQISKAFDGNGAPAKPAARRGRPPKSAAAKLKATNGAHKSKTRIPRGKLKAKVLAALEAAGSQGMAVSEVADKIGAKKETVNVWFYTTGKKVPGLKKIAPGRFALKS